jgi:inner membrane protein
MLWAAALGFLAASPDLDIVGFFLGIPYSDMLGHRGLFHSIPWAILVSSLFTALILRFRLPVEIRPTRVFLLATAAMMSHGALDAMTNGGLGVGLFQPFHSGRFFLPVRPIEVAAIHPSRLLPDLGFVLASEIVWVWLPVFFLILCVEGARRLARSEDAIDRPGSHTGRRLEPAASIDDPPSSGQR